MAKKAARKAKAAKKRGTAPGAGSRERGSSARRSLSLRTRSAKDKPPRGPDEAVAPARRPGRRRKRRS